MWVCSPAGPHGAAEASSDHGKSQDCGGPTWYRDDKAGRERERPFSSSLLNSDLLTDQRRESF